jgi:hypothetical protein
MGDLHQGLCLPSPFLPITLYHLPHSFCDCETYPTSHSLSLIQSYLQCHPSQTKAETQKLPPHHPQAVSTTSPKTKSVSNHHQGRAQVTKSPICKGTFGCHFFGLNSDPASAISCASAGLPVDFRRCRLLRVVSFASATRCCFCRLLLFR